MNKFYLKILVIMFCLALALPNGLFASANENYSTNSQVKPNSLFSVKVVSFDPLPQVLVAQTKPLASSVCVPTPTPQNSLLGGVSDLDLNQPANCFKMVESQTFSAKSLTVAAEVQILPKITVLGTGNFFLKPNFANSLPKTSEATEIFLAIALLAAAFTTKKSVQYDLAQKPESFVFKPGIFELQVLRC